MKSFLSATLLALPLSALAAPPSGIAEQLRLAAGGEASAERGERLFRARAGGGDTATCTACHSEDARVPGRHIRTGKTIAPLAPAANPERFTDMAKVEKWFRRNCNDVLGRDCSAREKADFAAYMLSLR